MVRGVRVGWERLRRWGLVVGYWIVWRGGGWETYVHRLLFCVREEVGG